MVVSGEPDTGIDSAMQRVLLDLALTSNGATTSWRTRGGADPDRAPRLRHSDAPHLYFAAEFDRAATDTDRERVLQEARDELRAIRYGRPAATAGETREERDARIVEHGEGVAARDVAIFARCGVRDVWRARAAAGRDTEFGRRPLTNGQRLKPNARRVEVLRLVGEGMNARQVAVALGVSYATVRRDLGRKA